MATHISQLAADRAARDAARIRFDTHYEALKADIEERGLAGRLADEAIERGKDLFDEAVIAIEDHPAVAGGTILALVFWFLKDPITTLLERLLGHETPWRKDPADERD